jgi:hypothetical protein
MRILVLWSGGLDSTTLIQKFLNEGNTVDTIYIELHPNDEKIKREKKAIKSILPYFKQNTNFNFIEPSSSVSIMTGASFLSNLAQLPVWLLGVIMYGGNNYDQIALGYVMNDDAISYLEDIKKVYYAWQGLSVKKLPELIFPFSKYSKMEILSLLNSKLINKITFCEGINNDNCGECRPCKRWKRLEEDGYVLSSNRRFIKKDNKKNNEKECEEIIK